MKSKLYFLSILLPSLLLISKSSFGQTNLNAGDISIIKMQTDTPDSFTFITYVDLAANTKIYFTDCGVNTSGVFNNPCRAIGTSEGVVEYVAPAGGIPAGTIITRNQGDGSQTDFTIYAGPGINAGSSVNTATSGDQITVFQDNTNPAGGSTPMANAKFIFILNLASSGFTTPGDPNDSNETNLPSGLQNTTAPFTALALGKSLAIDDEWDNTVYNGSNYNFASVADAKAALTDPANYIRTDDQTGDNNYVNAVNIIPAAATLTPLNNAPSATAPTAPTVLEDDTNIALADDIQVTDSDGDDQTITMTITGGTLTIGTTNISFGGGGNGTADFTASGTLVDINTALDAATFTPTADLNGTDTGTISFTTNDSAETSDPVSVSFDITPVNDEPSFTVGSNHVINEDAGPQTTSSWATSLYTGAMNESSQSLSFAVTNDNNALFSTQPAIDASGTLTYESSAGANGTTTVSVVLSDDGGTANGGDDTFATQNFTITINPVNNEPSFVKGVDQFVVENAGPQTVNSWATSLDKGAVNESDQSLSFAVTNDNNALFSTQPAIDAAGSLTYETTMDMNGVATVSVILSDNGGTANGGDDTFTTQSFTITVVAKPTITSIADDTGDSTTDYITSDNTPTVNGTATPMSTVFIIVNGNSSALTPGGPISVTANSMGQYTFPFPVVFGTLPDGIANISVSSTLNSATTVSDVQAVMIDTEDPSVIITSTEASPTTATTIPVTVTFSESVSGLVLEELIVANGSAQNLSGSGDTYTVDIVPTADGTVTVDIAADVTNDIAGNGNTIATQFSIEYDEITLGIENQTLAQELQVIPNPASDYIHISHQSNQKLRSLEVYTMLGKLVLSQKLNAISENTISLASIPSGIYWFRINTSNASAFKRVVVK